MREQTFFTAFTRVKELAEDFLAAEHKFLESSYSEAQARIDFIDKFWVALGWDVNHERERNPYRQEVKVERGVAVSNRLKKADYAFFAAPNFRDVKFYVEAKKPSRNLDNADDYFQTIRYGWSSNTPIAVLTDFEQFRVIDCRYKPNINTAINFALKKFSYREYADEEKFREIYHLFSREAVLSGSLEDFTNSLPKRGRGARQDRLFAVGAQKSVDESFLDDLDGYRAELARAFKNKNSELDGEELTEAVTRTLDRLVFIRFLEDKLIEPDTMMDKFDSWSDFVRASAKLNGFYNGIIFKPHFIDSPDFKPDENVFTNICGELSHKDSPYYLGDIPVHILGSVYERFLGKVIVATDKRAAVQEKPEVRKAGGVYYTPEYIVRYIVENTVGKLIENKTPAEIAGMRFADIACGSGSFLLGVYDYLLRYHTTYYNSAGKKGEARAAGCIENADGSFTLTIAQRREILRNNIYGVDVDAQAVEVAQLSLALKLLEDATTATARAFQPKLGEKILPDMTKNIICGNSLVDWDILDGHLFERSEERKLNPMSYEDKFPEIMRRGGFDAIVGNPPYDVLEKERGNSFSPHATISDYVKTKSEYEMALGGKLNLFRFFIVKGITILKPNGLVGMIVPLSLIGDISCSKTRQFLLTSTEELKLDCFPQKDNPNKRIFKDAKLSTVIFTGSKTGNSKTRVKIRVFPANSFEDAHRSCEFSNEEVMLVSPNNFTIPQVDNANWKICVKVHSRNKVKNLFAVEDLKTNRGEINQTIFRQFITNDSTKSRLLKGVEVGRYVINEKLSQGHREWFDEDKFLKSNSPKSNVTKTRIATQRITGVDEKLRVVAMKVNPVTYFADSTNSIIISDKSNYEYSYLLGLLNSKLFQWRFKITSTNNNVGTNELDSLPFRTINFDNTDEKAAHDRMVALVEQMLDAKKHLQAARTDRDKTFYQDRCNALDRQIDKLVYELYELTPEEIKIVENS
jgi:Alw26I/Eco31I/Esp3I family type II restriction m6 adenine DNA methyltransferase